VRGDAFRILEGRDLAHAPFDVVFLDPPYAMEASEVAGLVRTLYVRGMLSEECLLVYERAQKGAGLEMDGWRVLRTREQADTAVDLMRRDVT
jgi:16S rRNA (guanine966-N2)-methyltransferase